MAGGIGKDGDTKPGDSSLCRYLRRFRPADASGCNAELQQDASQPHAWALWSLETKLEKGEHELVVRAFDEAMQTQPDTPNDTWNFAGYLATHWHRISVSAE